MELNKDIAERDKLIYGRYRPRKYAYGSVLFNGLSVKALNELINQKFIDFRQTTGHSPTVKEMLGFAKRYSDYTFHGYTTEENICITGIDKECVAPTADECQDFLRLFRNADDLRVDGYMYASYIAEEEEEDE